MVEFALTAIVALLVLFLGIQFALLGQAALAVGQLAYQGARYASINPNLTDAQVVSWMQGVASPTIASSDTKTLNISVSDASGTNPRPFQSTVTVTVTLDPIRKKLVLLPNPFFGINFGGTISSTQNAMVD
jgi:hypothetical protein